MSDNLSLDRQYGIRARKTRALLFLSFFVLTIYGITTYSFYSGLRVPKLSQQPEVFVQEACSTQEQEPNNVTDQANTICEDTVVQGNLPAGDTDDYYSFSLNEVGLVKISLTGIPVDTGADYDLYLYLKTEGDYEQIASSAYSNTLKESISKVLAPGNYFIRVYAFANNPGSDKYSLKYTLDSSYQEKILFSSDRDGDDEIFMMSPDGSNVQQITHNTVDDLYPSISPDGKKIAFSRREADFNWDLWIMDSSGANQQKLVDVNSDYDSWTSFSPDGNQIVYDDYSKGWGQDKLYIVNTDGSNNHLLLMEGDYLAYPYWADDGYIYFSHTANHKIEKTKVWRIRPDGTEFNLVGGTDEWDSAPVVCHDYVFFEADEKKYNIYKMRKDGSEMTKIYNSGVSDYMYSCFADKQKLIIGSHTDGDIDIYTINYNGGDVQRLTDHSANDIPHSWGYVYINNPPTGYLDQANCSYISGWACDADDYSQPIDVHVYADGQFLTHATANLQREQGVCDTCSGECNHGFAINTSDLPELLDNQTHEIKVYAINYPDGQNNPELPNSPQTLGPCTAPINTTTPMPTTIPTTIPTVTPTPIPNTHRVCANDCLVYGTATACDSDPECSWYFCSDRCLPTNTIKTDACIDTDKTCVSVQGNGQDQCQDDPDCIVVTPTSQATPTPTPQGEPTPTSKPTSTPKPTTIPEPTNTPTPIPPSGCDNGLTVQDGDINGDCVVNTADWSVMRFNWTSAGEL